ncbi:MAG TPA: hypothetical protein VE439_11060 [Anaerolineae bacterium]|nr:hypothetical protein [Anaerolineae bacterium]
MIDFSYKVEPQHGKFPYEWGPMSLLKDTKMNWYGKKAFGWLYWNALLPGRDLGDSPMPWCGKYVDKE